MSEHSADDFPCVRPIPPRERLPDGALRLCAPAKINLNLLVGPLGEDGFHPLDSYVCKITLYDSIDLFTDGGSEITLTCRGMDCGSDENNLALRAARELSAAVGKQTGARIVLDKRIPPGMGLAGGSSDAAAVLAGLNDLWGIGLAPGELAKIGVQLGSDVPLFLTDGAVRMRGRGERITPARIHDFYAILYLPDFTCATPEVYRRFDTQPRRVRRNQLPAELLASSPPSVWREMLVNDLATAAGALCPPLAEVRGLLREAAGIPVCETGSGSAMFMLCDDRREGRRVLATLPEKLARRCVAAAMHPW